MFESVKAALSEVIDLADSCPDKYQLKCFEVLLESLVKVMVQPPASPNIATVGTTASPQPGSPPSFFDENGITQGEWTRVFNRDGNSYTVIARDLKVKPIAQKQVRLALLLGIKSLLETAEAVVPKDALVLLCKNHSAYDAPNFSRHMKKSTFFQSRGNGWVLTVPGQQQSAVVIKELAQ